MAGTRRLTRARRLRSWSAISEFDSDEVDSPERLAHWLVERELLPRSGRVSAADQERVRALRGGLRELTIANHGDDAPSRGAIEALNDSSAVAEVAVEFGRDGNARLHPRGQGVDRAIGRIAAILRTLPPYTRQSAQ